MLCSQCPRKCNAVREDNSSRGAFCNSPSLFKIARAALHFGEEPCVSGIRGSGTVFFSGCNLKCVFCQNEKISHRGFGKTVSAVELKNIFNRLIEQGCENINLVNPTHYAKQLSEVLDKSLSVPVIYNSSGYESIHTLSLLNQKIDVYMPDLKYLFNDISLKYSGARDYPDVAKSAIKEMFRQRGKFILDDKGIIRSGVIIRHLVLPDNLENTFECIDWVRDNFKDEVIFSLMTQYTPCNDLPHHPELRRYLTVEEYDRVTKYLEYCGLKNAYYQEYDLNGEAMIPDFDLTGVI